MIQAVFFAYAHGTAWEPKGERSLGLLFCDISRRHTSGYGWGGNYLCIKSRFNRSRVCWGGISSRSKTAWSDVLHEMHIKHQIPLSIKETLIESSQFFKMLYWLSDRFIHGTDTLGDRWNGCGIYLDHPVGCGYIRGHITCLPILRKRGICASNWERLLLLLLREESLYGISTRGKHRNTIFICIEGIIDLCVNIALKYEASPF